ADVDSFKRCGTSNTSDVRYRVRKDLILHRSSINNSASLSNKFGGFYFNFKFGILGLLHDVVTTIADRIQDADVDSFKRCGTSNTFDVRYRVRKDLILHRSSINNSASLSNKFGGFYFNFKFGILGLLHDVVTTIADRIQ
nr:hypothetical protein [Tanacetum cinerariifolium]